MRKDFKWQRFIYLSILLILAAAINLAIVVIPPPTTIPDMAVDALWMNIAIQLVLIAGIFWILWKANKGDWKKELLIIVGALAIIMSLVILDGVFAYYGDAERHSVAVSMIITSILDFIAGLFIIFTGVFRKRMAKQQ
jgi:membrane protease YdiL (CAAX protease family)